VQAVKPRFPVPAERQRELASAFFAASRSGDVAQLRQLLAKDVVFYGDGGGKRNSAINPIVGMEKVLRLLAALATKAGWDSSTVLAELAIDGLPGRISLENDALPQTIALEFDDGKITRIYVTRNPDKLGHLARFSGA
jgi:RNA polymerase sigma-70 factor (ECF subfamily)